MRRLEGGGEIRVKVLFEWEIQSKQRTFFLSFLDENHLTWERRGEKRVKKGKKVKEKEKEREKPSEERAHHLQHHDLTDPQNHAPRTKLLLERKKEEEKLNESSKKKKGEGRRGRKRKRMKTFFCNHKGTSLIANNTFYHLV